MGNAVIDTTVGPNVTFNEYAASTAPSQSSFELAGPVTSPSDVINLDAQTVSECSVLLQLDRAITFMSPPPERINVENPSAIGADVGASISFNTLPVSAASYTNAVLSLSEAGHVMPINVSGLNSSDWILIQSAPKGGLVHAELSYAPGGYNSSEAQRLPIPTGGSLIHVT